MPAAGRACIVLLHMRSPPCWLWHEQSTCHGHRRAPSPMQSKPASAENPTKSPSARTVLEFLGAAAAVAGGRGAALCCRLRRRRCSAAQSHGVQWVEGQGAGEVQGGALQHRGGVGVEARQALLKLRCVEMGRGESAAGRLAGRECAAGSCAPAHATRMTNATFSSSPAISHSSTLSAPNKNAATFNNYQHPQMLPAPTISSSSRLLAWAVVAGARPSQRLMPSAG